MKVLDIFSWLPAKEMSLEQLEQIFVRIFLAEETVTDGRFCPKPSGAFCPESTDISVRQRLFSNPWRTFFYNSFRCTNPYATVVASTFFKCCDRRSRFQKISE